MKKKFLAFFIALALIATPASFAASALSPEYKEANAAAVALEETETGDPSTPTQPEEGSGDPETPDEGGTPEDGAGDETPDEGETGDENEKPEEPAVPLDTSVAANIVGYVVLGLVVVSGVFALILCLCGKRKIAGDTKKKKKA